MVLLLRLLSRTSSWEAASVTRPLSRPTRQLIAVVSNSQNGMNPVRSKKWRPFSLPEFSSLPSICPYRYHSISGAAQASLLSSVWELGSGPRPNREPQHLGETFKFDTATVAPIPNTAIPFSKECLPFVLIVIAPSAVPPKHLSSPQ